MTVVEKLIDDNMMLVVYDFKATSSGNSDRIKFHRIITSKPFYGVMMNQSVYYLYASMVSLNFVRSWASNTNADIKVFGNVDLKLADAKRYAKQYVRHLKDTVSEVNEIAKMCRKDLLEFEEDVANPDKDLRGFPSKIKGVTNRFEDIRKAINKIGTEDDEFELDKLATFMENLKERYEKVKAMRIKIMSQND